MTDSVPLYLHLPCSDCGSSDAKTVYNDGHSFCFSCRNLVKFDNDFNVKGSKRKNKYKKGIDKTTEIVYPNLSILKEELRDISKDLINDLSNSSLKEHFKPSSSPKAPFSSHSSIDLVPPSVGLSSPLFDKSPEDGLGSPNHPSPPPSYQPTPKSPPAAFLGASRAIPDGDLPSFSQEVPKKVTIENNQNKPYRGLDKATLSAYNVGVDSGIVSYGYTPNSGKRRRIKDKKFWTEGEFANKVPLFGMHLFPPGSAKAITLFEGEDDAMAGYEMTGSRFPCVSIPGGVATAERDCSRHRDYINSFDAIYICFDNDKPGQEATEKVARLFNPNKVYIVKLHKHKDAMEYFEGGKSKEFVSVWYAAKRHRPKGIVSSYNEIESILSSETAERVADYPFSTLDGMALGIRTSEVVLVTAPSGIGKTEVLRAIEYKILKDTDYNIGVIHLEERERRAMMGLITYHLKTPVHRPDSNVSLEDKIKAYKDLTKRDDRVHYYQHFGSEDPNVIMDVIRHLVTVDNCKFIFLDHITMLVTGQKGDDERKVLDYLSTALASLTRELDFCLFLVSHENANEGTRGSANIENIADLWFRVNRDKLSPDPEKRNLVEIVVKKNRFGSDTGPAGVLKFDKHSYTLDELVIPDFGNPVNEDQTKERPSDPTEQKAWSDRAVSLETTRLLGEPSAQGASSSS